MGILQRNLNGRSLYEIYRFLKLMIATNRDEEEAEVQQKQDTHCLYAMTVHKAKGQEFDTVLLPYTDMSFLFSVRSEMLVSNEKDRIGWRYSSKDGRNIHENLYYHTIREQEDLSVCQEETRILYVAMTRSIYRFHALVSPKHKEDTWGDLLDAAEI